MTLFIILAVLFVSLVLVISITERFGNKDASTANNISKFIVPLLIIMVVLQVLKALFWSEGF